MFALAKTIAPAARSRSMMNASFAGVEPSRASDPAVVVIASAVSMLSLIATGMPCNGPRGPWVRRSVSSWSASSSASGLVSMMARNSGPRMFIWSMRSRYSSAMERAV